MTMPTQNANSEQVYSTHIGNRKVYYKHPRPGDRYAWAFTDEHCTDVVTDSKGDHLMISIKDLTGFQTWPENL